MDGQGVAASPRPLRAIDRERRERKSVGGDAVQTKRMETTGDAGRERETEKRRGERRGGERGREKREEAEERRENAVRDKELDNSGWARGNFVAPGSEDVCHVARIAVRETRSEYTWGFFIDTRDCGGSIISSR